MSYNLVDATIKDEHGYAIDWHQLAIAKGYPNPMTDPTLTIDEDKRQLRVQWELGLAISRKYNLSTFACHLVLLTSTDGITFYSNENTIHYPLTNKQQTLAIVPNHHPQAHHVYVFYYATDMSNKCTDSKYLGIITY